MRLQTIALILSSLAACSTTTVHEEESVMPGINERWTDPALDMDDANSILESESREIFVARHALVEALGLTPGMRVADVGAGTGFMSTLFAERVGASGRVYAVELSQAFVEHLRELAADRGLAQIEAVQCTERSCELPRGSVDLAFLCDTYHHLEYPRSTLASLRAALRRGGELWIVDFERIEGESSDWVLGHVRAGSSEVVVELEKAGFQTLGRVPIEGLEENYALRFRRR